MFLIPNLSFLPHTNLIQATFFLSLSRHRSLSFAFLSSALSLSVCAVFLFSAEKQSVILPVP